MTTKKLHTRQVCSLFDSWYSLPSPPLTSVIISYEVFDMRHTWANFWLKKSGWIPGKAQNSPDTTWIIYVSLRMELGSDPKVNARSKYVHAGIDMSSGFPTWSLIFKILGMGHMPNPQKRVIDKTYGLAYLLSHPSAWLVQGAVETKTPGWR